MKRNRLRKLFVAEAYWSYSNLSRFFIRVFAGVMFLQFGVRQMANYDFFVQHFPNMLGLGSFATLNIMITIEVVCSVMLIFGFLTRISTILPTLSMIVAECYVLSNNMILSDLPMDEKAFLTSLQLGYVPMLFVGMFVFILLSGPGKISVDYLLSLYLTNKDNLNELKTI